MDECFCSPAAALTGATAQVDAEADGCPVPAGARRALVFSAIRQIAALAVV